MFQNIRMVSMIKRLDVNDEVAHSGVRHCPPELGKDYRTLIFGRIVLTSSHDPKGYGESECQVAERNRLGWHPDVCCRGTCLFTTR